MRARILTGSALGIGVAVVLLLNQVAPQGLVPWAVAMLLMWLSVGELWKMGSIGGPLVLRALAVPAALTTVFSYLALVRDPSWPVWLVFVAIYPACLCLPPLMAMQGGDRQDGGSSWKVVTGLALWVLPPFAALGLFERDWGPLALFVLILLSKIGDIFGYFVGRAIGKRHPFPRVSPNKTVAGCVASLVAALVAGLVCSLSGLLPDGRWAWLGGLAVGALVNLAAQGGDLLESAVKRRSGVKDSSTLVGAAGGVLDVVDSLLLSAPLALLLWPWLFGPLAGD